MLCLMCLGLPGTSCRAYRAAPARHSTSWEQINAPLLRCHPDRLTMKSRRNTLFVRMPRGCSSDQPRVWSALQGGRLLVVCVCVYVLMNVVAELSNDGGARRSSPPPLRLAGCPGRRRENMVGEHICLAEHHQTQTWLL